MVPAGSRPKLLAIVGPTAAGKSDLAMRIAKKFNGEIIACDSRTIYKGMNIGTAKPSRADQKLIPHWGLDLVEPGQRFSAAAFQKYAKGAIKNIQNRGKLPILVGGTGLYIDAVLFDFGFRAGADLLKRQQLEKLPTSELQEIIRKENYKMPENSQNKRYLIRNIERKGHAGSSKKSLPKDVILLGLLPSDTEIRGKIGVRVEKNFQELASETETLLNKYGEAKLATTAGIAYKTTVQFMKGELDKEQAKELIKNAEWQYARRQKTWFKRNKFIHWFGSSEQAYEFLRSNLAKR